MLLVTHTWLADVNAVVLVDDILMMLTQQIIKNFGAEALQACHLLAVYLALDRNLPCALI